VDGRTLRCVDSESIASSPARAPAFPTLPGPLLFVPGYNAAATVIAGQPWARTPSGVRADTTAAFAGLNAYVLDDGTGVNRFPVRAGTDGQLSQAEVARILAEAMKIANRARAQIRLPLGLPAQVSISVVDTNGAVLGLIRTPDAPVFGTDVAVQKARSALLFSRTNAAALLNAEPTPTYVPTSPIATYVTNMQATPGLTSAALTNGIAYSNRAIGNLARPFLPDGIDGSGPGPLSKAFANWSPFSDGLQLDLIYNKVVTNLTAQVAPLPSGPCSGVSANGIQIFPGSVPIFRVGGLTSALVGAIGVSGDGIDQDDMVAFLGLANAGNALGTGITNAPSALRADRITVPGGNLRYVSCPVAPFLDTTATNVCDGI